MLFYFSVIDFSIKQAWTNFCKLFSNLLSLQSPQCHFVRESDKLHLECDREKLKSFLKILG